MSTAAFGMSYAMLVLIATLVSLPKIFENVVSVILTVVFWILIFTTGNKSGLVGLFLLCFLAFIQRETLLRWFYLLTPHPAAKFVDYALMEGTLDVDAFAEAIKEGKGENQYERAARMQQMAALTERWRAHERTLRGREERMVAADRARTEKENELLRAQMAALEAAIEHEKAAARVEALQSARHSNVG